MLCYTRGKEVKHMDFQVIESAVAELNERVAEFIFEVEDRELESTETLEIRVSMLQELENIISGLEGDVSSVRSSVEDAAAEASNLQSYANDVENTLSY